MSTSLKKLFVAAALVSAAITIPLASANAAEWRDHDGHFFWPRPAIRVWAPRVWAPVAPALRVTTHGMGNSCAALAVRLDREGLTRWQEKNILANNGCSFAG